MYRLALSAFVISTLASGVTSHSLISRAHAEQVARDSQSRRVQAFGVTIGHTTFAEVKAQAAMLGLTCADLGRGSERPSSSQQFWAWLNPSSLDTQVSFACARVRADRIGRPGPAGELLFLFDGPDVPIRRVVFSQTYSDGKRARADFAAADEDFGSALTPGSEPESIPYRLALPFSSRFSANGVEASVTFVDLAEGATLTESIEVSKPRS